MTLKLRFSFVLPVLLVVHRITVYNVKMASERFLHGEEGALYNRLGFLVPEL